MGFAAFVKFALICFDALAWPLLALGYPLRASIQAIEANSPAETLKIVTYWVIFSLISLFENAFMGLLQWLPFWPYTKLTIICWLMIPRFDGAFYVYNHFVHPYLYMDVQSIIKWFKKQHESFLKDNFLAEADKYVKANGPEALEKLIAREITKGREPTMLQEDIKPVQVMEEKEIAAVNAIPEANLNASQTQADILAVACPEIKETTCLDLPEIPSDKQVQKEWTCALCQVTTTCENNLKMHLQGRRHRAACEELMKPKNQPSKAKVSLDSVPVKDSKKVPNKSVSSSSTPSTQKKQQPSNKALNPTSNGNKPDLPKEQPTKLSTNTMAGNKLNAGENVQGQQVIGKKHAGSNNLPFRCAICNIGCSRSEDLNCHLGGRKHMARIQELNRLRQGEIA